MNFDKPLSEKEWDSLLLLQIAEYHGFGPVDWQDMKSDMEKLLNIKDVVKLVTYPVYLNYCILRNSPLLRALL